MKNKNKKIKVVCVFGEFKKGSDFVLEPADSFKDTENIGEVFWIERCEENQEIDKLLEETNINLMKNSRCEKWKDKD